jgi:hypothetical protein
MIPSTASSFRNAACSARARTAEIDQGATLRIAPLIRLPQLVEQPRILHGNDSLCGKVLQQFDLLIRYGAVPGPGKRVSPLTNFA